MKNLFIGIDFSKLKFDVCVVDRTAVKVAVHQVFENTPAGCKSLIEWLKPVTTRPAQEWLFCGEDTGVYSIVLSKFLAQNSYSLWLENALQIKRSVGIKREKNDKVDSYAIALYAFRYADKAREFHLPDAALESLSNLLAFRERLLHNKHSLSVAATELRTVQHDKYTRYVYEQSMKNIDLINKQIKDIEREMKKLLQSSDELKENYNLMTSIKGISLLNATSILVETGNFSKFNDPRKFACTVGIAPFGQTSGSSIHIAPHVSHIANKRLKALLTSAARSAVRFDTDLRQYYERKIAEGKADFVVINNVRNKLVHRIFAVIKSRQPYREDYRNALNKTT
jgi:transposase